MSLLSLAVALALTQAPCTGKRVVLLPLQPVAMSAAEARRVEEWVRQGVAALPGACLEPRAQTVARVRARGGRLAGCADAACWGAQVVALGADRLVRGVALGVGGAGSVALTLVDREGQEAHVTLELPAFSAGPDVTGTVKGLQEARVREALAGLWTGPAREARRPARVLPTVMLAAGGVALAAGVGFGLAARQLQQRLSTGNADCPGKGAAFRECFAGRLQEGRTRAGVATGLLGAGAVLGAGGTLLFIWETP